MDLRDYLIELMAPVEPGQELEPGLRFTKASTELGLRLSFLVEERDEVHVEVSPRELGLKYAARSPKLAFAYRDGGADHVDQRLGFRVCQTVAAHVGAREGPILERLVADTEAAAAVEAQSTRIREIQGTRLLELAGVPGQRFYTLSPYLGCLIGCRFCYAQSRLDPMRTLLRLPQIPWGSYVDIRINAPELLERELRELPRHVIKFCPIVSDPYQAVEKKFEVTRRCLEVIRAVAEPPPTLLMTRSTLVLRDIDILRDIPHAWVGASIPTLDDSVRKHFEPRAASIPERLDMLRTFKEAGIKGCVVVQPMLPGDPEALAGALAEVVDSVSIGVLRGEMGAEKDFADPRFAHARGEEWQRSAAFALRDALVARGVDVWVSELPPELRDWKPQLPV